MHCDVVIVGAGVSGLACAAALSARGITVEIFEARDDIGGRLASYNPPDGGPVLELGAQVIHGDRNPLRDLAASGLAGVPSPRSEPVPRDAVARVLIGGRILPFGALARGGMPPWVVEQKLTADRGGTGFGGGWDGGTDGGRDGGGGRGRGGWDGGTVEGWMDAQGICGVHRVAAEEWFRQNWAAEPSALSADGVAVARAGDQVGDGEYSFEGGYVSLARALAAAVPPVRLGQPVDAVTWSPGRAEVAAGRARVRARAVVITVPPALIDGGRPVITPMPAGQAAAARGLRAGDGLCAVAVLSRPAPESAVVFDADGRAGFVRATAGRPEVLIVAKSGAAGVVRAAGPAGLPGLVARAFPWAAGTAMTSCRIADWGRDPWSGGAFSYPRPGAARAAGRWAAPVRRTLFFAGEAATAGVLPPSVHGALGSGLAAARTVMEALA
jgi:monoamine oxidase